MDDGTLFGRGIAFPPRIGPDGRLQWSEGSTNIRESIMIILMTQPGERVMLRGFGAGLSQFLFEPNTVTTRRLIQEEIQDALGIWEPRIELEGVRVEADREDEQVANITISYRLVATGDSAHLDISLQFDS